jgi:hypothetical protein
MKVIHYIVALLGFLFLNFSGLAAGSPWCYFDEFIIGSEPKFYQYPLYK